MHALALGVERERDAHVAMIARRVGRTIAVLAALPWAVGLVVGGLWLVLVAAEALAPARSMLWFAGLTAIASGHVVFAVCVADRLFPGAPSALAKTVATAASLAALAGVAGLGVSLADAYRAAASPAEATWVGAER